MKKPIFYRVLFYAIGLLVLALGLTLNTKTGLGVSPIISVAYSIATIFDHNFGNMTLALYSLFAVIELILHIIRDRRYTIRIRRIILFSGYLAIFHGFMPIKIPGIRNAIGFDDSHARI